MTITQEAPMDAAFRLASGALDHGFKFEALHTYTDRDANPLYWRIRAKHPVTGKKWIRPMKLTGTGYELREPMKPVNGKPLYRLHARYAADLNFARTLAQRDHGYVIQAAAAGS